LADRVERWGRKYLREAKLRSSWKAPDAAYETKFLGFARTLLAQRGGAAFREDMDVFIRQIGPAGCANALVQAALRCTLPGLPDLFQGREFWDFSLVDPDNRRAVDYNARVKAIQRDDHIATLAWTDPRRKQALIAALLRCRQDNAALFSSGDYIPLRARGVREDNIVAFERRFQNRRLVVVAQLHCAAALSGTLRLSPSAEWWGATAVDVSLSGLKSALPFAPGSPATIRVADFLGAFPVFVGLSSRG
jgi:(1->4)-alpha-D-glucan 1-alpha-D-glucosylmutase